MTLFAGVYSFKPEGVIGNDIIQQFKSSLSRRAGEFNVFSNHTFAIVKYDCKAFGVPGFVENSTSVAALAGEPYLSEVDGIEYSRYSDLLTISEQLTRGHLDILRSCRGTYSLCLYDKNENSLVLATDKLGERPIYYYIDDDYLFFSSKLAVLEKVDRVPKKMNLSAFIEERAFGVPLGTNTYYCDIKLLRDGQYLQCQKDQKKIAHYFRWDHIAPRKRSSEELQQQCFDAFKSAVSSRIKEKNGVFACLSGGLDSRSVVSILNSFKLEVTAFNFSRPREQDEGYAAQYAETLGINYIATRRPPAGWTWGSTISDALDNVSSDVKDRIIHLRLVFTGDGGSVGVGHVYMSDELISLLKQERIDEALRYFLKRRGFPRRIFRKDILSALANVPFESLKREFDDIEGTDPGRKFYLFLLRNDQRRHLHQFFEDIDLNGVELLLPFYDSRLLETIISAPVEGFIGHRFYHDWLRLFPPDFQAVPWQTYHGHLPCPVPTDSSFIDQWSLNKKEKFKSGGPTLRQWLDLALARDFPDDMMKRSIFVAALVMHHMKIQDYEYIFNFSDKVQKYYKKCSQYRINYI